MKSRDMYSTIKKFLNAESYFGMVLITLCLGLPQYSNAQPVRGVPGDLWADRILGQLDYGQTAFNETNQHGTFQAFSSVVDNVHNRLYVYDSGNNRILGVSSILSLSDGQGADVVLGQPDFNHTGFNGDSNWQNYPTPPLPTASTLGGLTYKTWTPAEADSIGNMAVDPNGNLYVPDYFNNRVLRYDWPIATGQAASHVWGQPDFVSSTANEGGSPSATSVHFTDPSIELGGIWANIYIAGVGVDSWGNLWVADTQNNRVLRFPNQGGVPSTTADTVLGQANFTSSSPTATGPTDTTHMLSPTAVRVDAQGNVYVTDLPPGSGPKGCSGRVLIYQPTGSVSGVPTYTNGELPLTEFGQNYLARPVGLEFDVNGSTNPVQLWVSDSFQILLYTINYSPSFSAVVTKTLLQSGPQLTTSVNCTPVGGDGPAFTYADGGSAGSQSVCDVQGSVGVDANGNVFVAGKAIEDVWRFPAPIPTPQAGIAHSADKRVFQTQQFNLFNTRSNPARGMYYAIGVAIGEAGGITQVIGAERSRLIFWDVPASGPAGLTNGQNADGTAGYSNPSYPLDLAHPELGRICADKASAQPHLWAIRGNDPNYVVQVYNLPLHNGDTPAATITPPFSVLGGGSVNPSHVEGIAVDPTGTYLWLSDQADSRVFRIRNPLTSPVVDIILGQTSASGTGCNVGGVISGGVCTSSTESASTLNQPGAVVLDHHGDLFVSDHSLEVQGNQRLLRWNSTQFPASPASCVFGLSADAVYGTGGSFSTTNCAVPNGVGICHPWEPAFNSDDSVMVVGTNGQSDSSRFPNVLQNPLSSDNPIANLKDYGPQSYAAVFDDQDNLYETELTRSRLMIYLNPFPTPCCQGYALPTPIASPSVSLNQPLGMAVNYGSGLVYLVDSGNKALKAYNTSTGAAVGSPFVSWTGGSFSFPNDVAVDSHTGNIYVSDGSNGVVYEFTSAYNYVTTIGSGVLGFPRGVWVDIQGTTTSLYVAAQNGNVYRFDSTNAGNSYPSAANATFGGSSILGVPNGLVKVGNMVYVTNDSGQVIGFNAGNGYASSVVYSCGSSLKAIRTDLAGNYYVTEVNGNVDKFLWSLSNPPVKCAIPNNPWGTAVDGSGKVFVSEMTGAAVSVLQGCVTEPTPPSGFFKARPLGNQVQGDLVTNKLTPTPTPVFTLTPTPTPDLSRGSQVVAVPNVSHGEPMKFLVPLDKAAEIRLSLFTITGEDIYRTTTQGSMGLNTLTWNLQNEEGVPVASGLYLYLIQTDDGTTTITHQGKVVVLH